MTGEYLVRFVDTKSKEEVFLPKESLWGNLENNTSETDEVAPFCNNWVGGWMGLGWIDLCGTVEIT